MAQGERDGNQVVVKLGSFNGTPIPLKVENATGYLKAKIQGATLVTPAASPTIAEKDDNSVSTALGTFNNLPKALQVTNADGYLRAVIQ